MRIIFLISLIGSVLLSSCEEPFELDVPTKIVMDSRIQAGRSPEVTVRVVDGFGQTLALDALQESKVTIQGEDDSPILLKLSASTDTSATFCTELTIEAGNRYSLLIEAPGFSDLNSFTDVPRNVLPLVGSTGERGPEGGLLPVGDRFFLPISFDDTRDEKNFYQIVVTVQDADADGLSQGPVTLPFTLFPLPSDASQFNETGWMFSDDDFHDARFLSQIVILKSLVVQFPKPVVTIELRSISVDYFNYHIQNSRPKGGSLPSYGQAGQIDNIAGGAGLFGGYTSNESSYLLEF